MEEGNALIINKDVFNRNVKNITEDQVFQFYVRFCEDEKPCHFLYILHYMSSALLVSSPFICRKNFSFQSPREFRSVHMSQPS